MINLLNNLNYILNSMINLQKQTLILIEVKILNKKIDQIILIKKMKNILIYKIKIYYQFKIVNKTYKIKIIKIFNNKIKINR